MIRQAVRLLIIVFVAALAATAVYAEDPPPAPQAFYGAVKLYGRPAPIGVQVEARGEGVLTGIEDNPLAVTVAGQYGGPAWSDGKLFVQGMISDGTPIEFYVNGVKAECAAPDGLWASSYPFASGVVTELNLRVGYYAYLPVLMR